MGENLIAVWVKFSTLRQAFKVVVLGFVIHGSACRLCMYVRGRESNTLWVESKSVKANGENLRAVWVKFSTLR
jgi:hypothetical protein